MSEYSNILEIIDSDSNALDTRTRLLKNYTGLGLPDMCLVTREHRPTGLKKLLTRSYNRSYFHYIYGSDTSSLASIAAYFRHFLGSFNNKNASSPVIFGCFCVFDLFSKHDIRVEIHIPGQANAYMVDANGSKFQAEEIYWQGAYLSSVLRAMYPIRGTAVAGTSFFKTFEEIERFMSLCQKFSSRLGFVLGDIGDTKKYGFNLIIPALSKYLLKRKRYKLHQALFKKYIENDPLMLFFLGKSSIQIGKLDEIIRLLSNQIKITPHAFPLYYTLAKAYTKRQEYSQAIRLCQYLIELNLDVYEYWHLLVLCYIKTKDYNSALLCFNIAPHSAVDEAKLDLEAPEEKILIPEKISYSAAGNIWITPTELDFRPFEDQATNKTSKEKNLYKKISSLPGFKLQGSKLRAYKLLVKMEKQIEWENLLKIKQSILKKVAAGPGEEEKLHSQMMSSLGGELNRSGFTRTLFHTLSQDFQQEMDPYVDEELQPAQVLTCRNYFLPDSNTNKLSFLMNPLSRVQSDCTTELYNCLHSDLKAVYEWQKESSDIQAVHALKSKK